MSENIRHCSFKAADARISQRPHLQIPQLYTFGGYLFNTPTLEKLIQTVALRKRRGESRDICGVPALSLTYFLPWLVFHFIDKENGDTRKGI